MSTFSEFKDEILAHNASNQWVDSNTNANDIYWKLLYSNSGYINKIANNLGKTKLTNLFGKRMDNGFIVVSNVLVMTLAVIHHFHQDHIQVIERYSG